MSMLTNFIEKAKDILGKSYIQIGIMVFLISLLSFGIGYIFGRDFNPAPIIIEQHNES